MNDNTPNGHLEEPTIDPDDPNANGLRAYAILGKFLEDDKWFPQEMEGKHAYHTFFKGKNGEFHCYAQIRLELEQFIFYAVVAVRAEEEARLAVAEFIARANYGLRIGNFELDLRDGEVRFKSSIDFEGVGLNGQLIKNTIYPAVQTADHYLPGLMKVMYGGTTPMEAIEEIENPTDS